MTEENNVVIAEGTVQAKTKNGTIANLVFCDVFEMQKGLIKECSAWYSNYFQTASIHGHDPFDPSLNSR